MGVVRSFAAEFPNDNSDLHVGTIWMADELCGGAVPHFSDYVECVDQAPEELIVTVESVEIEATVEEVSLTDLLFASDAAVMVEEADVTPIAPPGETFDTIPLPAESGIVPSATADRSDSYTTFLQALTDVAKGAGHHFLLTEIASALAGDAVAGAWCAILRGESEDFALCGTSLDEWAGTVLARIVGAPQKGSQFRKDLRERGVAAFGMIEAA